MESQSNECDLSCAPANPRRPLVPGPEGVKSATEDGIEVATQASMPVNATGQKKLVQQAFHPSLFLNRPRSSSLGSLSNQASAKEKCSQSSEDSAETLRDTTCPPPWQRVPVSRGVKRKKTSYGPVPESVITSNKFSGLQIDLTDEDSETTTVKKTSKPPPIILYGVDDINKLTEMLETVADVTEFTFKITNRNQLRMNCVNMDVYKRILTLVREKGLIGHTFNRKDERCLRIVIRNLHPSTPIDIIKEEVEATGNIVKGEIINAKFGPEKKPTSTFFVNLLPGPNNKAAKDLKFIYHQSVVIEDPRKRRSIIQCHRCQQYGHSKNYCMRPPRCVKCGQSHKTSDCDKKDRNTPALCALCSGPHPANYKGCEVYREILARRMKPPTTKRKILENPPSTKGEQFKTAYPRQRTQIHNTYAEAIRSNSTQQTDDSPDLQPPVSSPIEQLLLKQTEKYDLILQQMSALMMLINKLINKISK